MREQLIDLLVLASGDEPLVLLDDGASELAGTPVEPAEAEADLVANQLVERSGCVAVSPPA